MSKRGGSASNETLEDTVESHKKQKRDDLVRELNALPDDVFHARFVQDVAGNHTFISNGDSQKAFDISHQRSRTLSNASLVQCLNLIASTSEQHYRSSSMGWRPKHKRREMLDEDMHYLIVTQHTDRHERTAIKDVDEEAEEMKDLAGFLSFMLTYDSNPVVPVLYIYEIHLSKDNRNCGLGKHLMDAASQIASRTGVTKIMLTCFVSNAQALRFYRRYGFEIDACSPEDRKTRGKIIRTDHLIMSRLVG